MDKRSKKFDQELLEGLIGKSFPVDDFEKEMTQYFRAKSLA